MIAFTALHALDGALAKTASFGWDDADWTIEPYSAGSLYDATEVTVRDIREFSAVLTELERLPNSAIVRGALKPGIANRNIRRLMHDKADVAATFEPQPRRWVMLDIDGRVAANPLLTDQERLAQIVCDLPEFFHDVSFHYQWSSKAGICGWDELSVHLFYALDEPWLDDMLRQRAADEDWGVDLAVFNAVQVHYTAAPVFKNCADPLAGRRSGFVAGKRDVVTMSTWTRPVRAPRPAYLPRLNAIDTFREKLTHIGPSFHVPIIAAILTLVDVTNNNFDDDFCISEVMTAVDAAPGGRKYIDERYLKRVINGARKKYQDEQEITK